MKIEYRGVVGSPTKCNKMHQNGHCTMTKQSILNLSWVTNMIHFWSKLTLGSVEESEQVMEGSRGCTWVVPKCAKIYKNGHHSMTKQSISNLFWVTSVIHIWSKWTIGRVEESEQVMEGSWGRTCGTPKCTVMDQKAPKWSLLHHRAKYYKLSWVTHMTHLLIKWSL